MNWGATTQPLTYPIRAERRQSIISELQEVYEKEISFDHWENADPPRFLESTGNNHTHG